MQPQEQPVITWYVMLFPDHAETAEIVNRLSPISAITGGVINPAPHVTIGYFQGEAEQSQVVASLQHLTLPQITIRASGLISFTEEEANPLFGYTMAMQVEPNAAIHRWQAAIYAALQPTGLVPIRSIEEIRLHINILRYMVMNPKEAIKRLDDSVGTISFSARRLIVSKRIGDDFIDVLELPLETENEG